RRSRGHVKETIRAWSVVRVTHYSTDSLFGAEDSSRQPATGNCGDVAPLRLRLESRGPRRIHERLRAGFADELHGGRARAVRLAGAVRSVSEELLRSGEVARLALVRRAWRAGAHNPFRVRYRAVQAVAPRLGHCEWAVHARGAAPGRPVADF